jgi:hypothetical protein
MFDEIKKVSNKLFSYEISLSYGGGYFIGVKKILCISNEQISVLLSDCVMHVYGEHLTVSKLIDGDLAFSGEVVKTERQKL